MRYLGLVSEEGTGGCYLRQLVAFLTGAANKKPRQCAGVPLVGGGRLVQLQACCGQLAFRGWNIEPAVLPAPIEPPDFAAMLQAIGLVAQSRARVI